MSQMTKRVRVLYSFPNRLGGERICYTAWQQVNGLAAAGAEVILCAASNCRPLPPTVSVWPTLSRGKLRIPFKLIGNGRAHALHDQIVAQRVRNLAGKIDVVHTWPSGALRTLKAAAHVGIPTVFERCNSHTRYVYETVRNESERLGVHLDPNDEAAYNERTLRVEEEEFRLADRLLCPSDFVARTFLDRGFSQDSLARHIYGFDEDKSFPAPDYQPNAGGLRMLFVGFCAVRKGLHFALDAWLRSPAHREGTFSIAGRFSPDYARKLAPALSHPSVRVLGHRSDVPDLMRSHDVLVLPSLEEGFPLVCAEALGTGCVPVVSEVCAGICRHMENSLLHRVGDVDSLTRHISLMHSDRALLKKLRTAGLGIRDSLTWRAAGVRLLEVYRETIELYSARSRVQHGKRPPAPLCLPATADTPRGINFQ
jgi:glycosyltransferase involved in cell wall biosynthesis